MSQSTNKTTKQVSLRHLPWIRIGISLLWVENPSLLSKECNQTVNHLRALDNCHIFFCKNMSTCFKYLKRAKSYERIIIVTNVYNNSVITADISRLCQYQQIQSIFIMSLSTKKENNVDIDLSANTREEIAKIGGVFHEYQPLLDRLTQIMNEVDELDDDLFTFFDRPEKALRDLRHELGSYIWSQALRVIFKGMSYNSPAAKREMLVECRACYYNDPHTLVVIDEFERNYRSADAVLWYTKPCFLYRLINKALRTEDNLVVYKFRYFIMALCARLRETALISAHHIEPFRVYRGSKLSRYEVERLEIGSLVATNGFFSSSRDLNVAKRFIGIDPDTGISPSHNRSDQRQYILFEIGVDLKNSPDIVVTDVSSYSFIPDENEILFDLGTTFIITGINYDDEHRVWNIRMSTSSELALISEKYNNYTLERSTETTPAISFGHLTCEVLSDYPTALSYLHRLLRSKSWDDDDRSGTYYYLARVYLYMGKYEQAIKCCQCVQLLLRRRLLEFSITYVRSLNCLSMIYLELGDITRAIDFNKRASEIYRKTLPKNSYEFGFHFIQTAYVHWKNGQYESARDLLENISSLIEQAFPPNYLCNALRLHIMGLVQHSLNNREQSIHYFKQSLQIRESFHASDHPGVARTCYELSKLYAEENNYSLALDYAQRALRIQKAKLPRNHQDLRQSIELIERLSSP